LPAIGFQLSFITISIIYYHSVSQLIRIGCLQLWKTPGILNLLREFL